MEAIRQRWAVAKTMAALRAQARGQDAANDPGADEVVVQFEVNALVEAFSEPGEAFDYHRHADATEAEIARHETQQHLDPPDPAFWRAVVAELRRRAARRKQPERHCMTRLAAVQARRLHASGRLG
jgi:hypothetical protein